MDVGVGDGDGVAVGVWVGVAVGVRVGVGVHVAVGVTRTIVTLQPPLARPKITRARTASMATTAQPVFGTTR